MSHLTYIGDSDVGEYCNFGCGTVTSNYDGEAKHRCKIGDFVFLGCNTNLIAPVTVGDGAYTAAGSTITGEVPAGALAIAAAARPTRTAGPRRSWAPTSPEEKAQGTAAQINRAPRIRRLTRQGGPPRRAGPFASVRI